MHEAALAHGRAGGPTPLAGVPLALRRRGRYGISLPGRHPALHPLRRKVANMSARGSFGTVSCSR